jgi:uncharacterized RDD family membrane protein YckC
MSELKYAGFWRRFAAYIIDSMIMAFALVNFRWLMYWSLLPSLGPVRSVEAIHPLEVGLAAAVSLMSILLAWVYFSGMESSPLQATIGKLAVGIYVTDLQGQRISFGRATGRFFGKILSGAILLIGYLMAGFTAKKNKHCMICYLVAWYCPSNRFHLYQQRRANTRLERTGAKRPPLNRRPLARSTNIMSVTGARP